jgi:tRNA A37 threonylcarbamoyladenosine dehydratase
MDSQTLINIIIGIAGFFGGWVINSLSRSIIRIEDKLADLPDKYVAKDNYVRDIDDIKTMLGRIFQRLDAMADK